MAGSLRLQTLDVIFLFMDTALAQKSMTAEEFAVWAEVRPEKHWELFRGIPELQQSQAWGHTDAKGRIYAGLLSAITEGRLDYSLIDGVLVKTDAASAFQPDVAVFAKGAGRASVMTTEPLIVVEVLSPSTARRDLTVKLAGYSRFRPSSTMSSRIGRLANSSITGAKAQA